MMLVDRRSKGNPTKRAALSAARFGFSLVELLIVIAIIGVLAGLLLPAVQSSRESSRRLDCLNRLRQVSLAFHGYESARGHLPSGSVARPDPQDPNTPHSFYRWSALATALPHFERSAVFATLDLEAPLYRADFSVSPANRDAVRTIIPDFLCPSDRNERISEAFGPTNYAMCAGYGAGGGSPFDADGMFYINSATRMADIPDGTSRTVMASESVLGETPPPLTPRAAANPQLVYAFGRAAPLTVAGCEQSALWNLSDPPAFSWANGEFRSALYNHYATPNSRQFDCVSAVVLAPPTTKYAAYGWRTARSTHPGGVNAVMADGSGQFVEDAIELAVWQALSTRGGDEAAL